MGKTKSFALQKLYMGSNLYRKLCSFLNLKRKEEVDDDGGARKRFSILALREFTTPIRFYVLFCVLYIRSNRFDFGCCLFIIIFSFCVRACLCVCLCAHF